MIRFPLVLACAAVLALGVAASASAYSMAPDGFTPSWLDATPVAVVAPTVVTDDPPVTDPAPEPAGCPDAPVSLDPIASCPLDPDAGWLGDDDLAPLSAHCNYFSGVASNPCSHSRVGDPVWFFQCGTNGSPLTDGTVGSEEGGIETDPAARDDVTNVCGGPDWRSLSLR